MKRNASKVVNKPAPKKKKIKSSKTSEVDLTLDASFEEQSYVKQKVDQQCQVFTVSDVKGNCNTFLYSTFCNFSGTFNDVQIQTEIQDFFYNYKKTRV